MEDFVPHNGIKKMGEWGGVVQYGGGDSSMVVLFFIKPIQNLAKSRETNRPYFDDKIYVRIHPPGERLNIVEREARDDDKRRWPMQWHAFQQNLPQQSNGTPIDMLFPANPATAAALKASGVHTVEQCAELSAHAIENIGMGCQQWVNEAARYLKVANRGVKYTEMKGMLDERDREITSLKHKNDLLMAEIHNLREQQAKNVTMDQVQQMLANQGGGGKRGVFVPGADFDAQQAQINGTHPTRDLVKAAPKRKRARVNS